MYKHGFGTIWFRECIAASGVIQHQFIETIIEKWVYFDILKTNLPQSVTTYLSARQ